MVVYIKFKLILSHYRIQPRNLGCSWCSPATRLEIALDLIRLIQHILNFIRKSRLICRESVASEALSEINSELTLYKFDAPAMRWREAPRVRFFRGSISDTKHHGKLQHSKLGSSGSDQDPHRKFTFSQSGLEICRDAQPLISRRRQVTCFPEFYTASRATAHQAEREQCTLSQPQPPHLWGYQRRITSTPL